MKRSMSREIRPIRALTHPMWLVALVMLVVNDHVLKHSEVAGLMTGKLSDVAGLIVAPVLLAALLGVTTRRGLALAGVATGIVFAAINLSPSLAASWDAAVSVFVPFHTTVDPTDLAALLAIPLGLVMFEPTMRRALDDSRLRRSAQYALMTVGTIGCMATSMEPECAVDSDCPSGEICSASDFCVDQGSCDVASDCGAGEYCDHGEPGDVPLCVAGTACGDDGDCPGGECNIDGFCRMTDPDAELLLTRSGELENLGGTITPDHETFSPLPNPERAFRLDPAPQADIIEP